MLNTTVTFVTNVSFYAFLQPPWTIILVITENINKSSSLKTKINNSHFELYVLRVLRYKQSMMPSITVLTV